MNARAPRRILQKVLKDVECGRCTVQWAKKSVILPNYWINEVVIVTVMVRMMTNGRMKSTVSASCRSIVLVPSCIGADGINIVAQPQKRQQDTKINNKYCRRATKKATRHKDKQNTRLTFLVAITLVLKLLSLTLWRIQLTLRTQSCEFLQQALGWQAIFFHPTFGHVLSVILLVFGFSE